jgi:hypothetical protein
MTVCNHTREESWWEYDARGIPLARVCDRCKAEKLKSYRPDVLRNPNYEADEDIEADDWTGKEYAGYSHAAGYVD